MAAHKVRNSDDFWILGQGHVAFQLLWSAMELKLFDLLSNKTLPLDDIASVLDINLYPCRVLVTGLTSVGLLEKGKKGFKAAKWAGANLKNGGNYHRVLGWQRHIVYPGLEFLTESIQQDKNEGLDAFSGTGPTLYDRLKSNPDLELVFQNAMSGLSTEARESLVAQPIFKQHKHILDIGGGDGTNSIHLVTKWPKLRMSILDNESVIERARKNIQARKLSEKISVRPGNVFSATLPDNCDGFLMCHMVTIFSADENIAIFKKCRESLPKGGRIFLFNMFTNEECTGPAGPALGSAYFLSIASGKGFLYPVSEVKEWLLEAGYKKVSISKELKMNHRLISAVA